MMDEALRVTGAAGIGPEEVHFEAFAADTGGDPFKAIVANRNDTTVKVGGEESLLEALQRRFGASSCEVGNCGTCRVKLKAGRVEHRVTSLLNEDKAGHMLSCSRGNGRIIIELISVVGGALNSWNPCDRWAIMRSAYLAIAPM